MLDGVAGAVLRPGAAGYEAARQSFNALVDRRPGLIVQCESTDDVVAALAHAANAGLPVAIRGGDHSIAGYSVCEEGLVARSLGHGTTRASLSGTP